VIVRLSGRAPAALKRQALEPFASVKACSAILRMTLARARTAALRGEQAARMKPGAARGAEPPQPAAMSAPASAAGTS
jgi:hypothetical protein